MKKTFKYYYKKYTDGSEELLTSKINAKSKKGALLKIVIDHQGIEGEDEIERFAKAHKFVSDKAGENWSVENALDCINPLGSSNLALYRIDRIRVIKKNNTKIKKDKIVYKLSVEDLQNVAKDYLKRKLTEGEIQLVTDRLGDFIRWYDAIENTIIDVIKKQS